MARSGRWRANLASRAVLKRHGHYSSPASCVGRSMSGTDPAGRPSSRSYDGQSWGATRVSFLLGLLLLLALLHISGHCPLLRGERPLLGSAPFRRPAPTASHPPPLVATVIKAAAAVLAGRRVG